MGSLIAKLASAFSGGPVLECDDNKVSCCTTEVISNSSSSSHGSDLTRIPERWHTEKISAHSAGGS